ncbi:MAG: hypothetical protein U5K51_05355 [Flavobacteriaceae bacterium]|nr:hypothetical protein [Flavobacteriaceae bacterium]
MKKDIEIPEVEGVYLAIVSEHNEVYNCQDWYAYLINDKEVSLEMVLILSKGYGEDKETSAMRHKLEKLAPYSASKIELIQEDVLKLRNEFRLTFFIGDRLYEKKYILEPGLKSGDLRIIKQLNKKGVLLK